MQARPATLLKKTLAQVFFCEFFEISQNTFLTEHRETASEFQLLRKIFSFLQLLCVALYA